MLKSPGPFTVLAPNDEAFAALPKGTLEALLKDKQKLASVLTYHLIPGQAMATDVVKLESAKSAQGELLAIKAENDAVRVNSAKLLKTDIVCSNGVIHVIDAVLLPPTPTPPAVKQAKAALQVRSRDGTGEADCRTQNRCWRGAQVGRQECVGEGGFGRGPRASRRTRRARKRPMLALREGLREAVEILEFTPFQEAKLPQGFPELTPVGEIQVKTYPKYRLARVEMEDALQGGPRVLHVVSAHCSQPN